MRGRRPKLPRPAFEEKKYPAIVVPYSVVHGQLGGRADISAAPIKGLFLTWNICVNRARAHTIAVRGIAARLRQFVGERITGGEWPFAELLES
jgi:hypothetical protein